MKAIYPTISATLFSAASSFHIRFLSKETARIILKQIRENAKDATRKRTIKR